MQPTVRFSACRKLASSGHLDGSLIKSRNDYRFISPECRW